jgi:hypothetical protein
MFWLLTMTTYSTEYPFYARRTIAPDFVRELAHFLYSDPQGLVPSLLWVKTWKFFESTRFRNNMSTYG